MVLGNIFTLCKYKLENKFMLAHRFYASDSFLITAGHFCGVSVPSASQAV